MGLLAEDSGTESSETATTALGSAHVKPTLTDSLPDVKTMARVLDIPNPKPAESDQLWCTDPSERVKLRQVDDSLGMGSLEPLTVHSMFADAVRKSGEVRALGFKVDAKERGHQYLSFQEYYDLVCTVAKAFIKLGLEEGKGVGILGFNSVPWFISDLAAIFAGGLACGVYATNTPDACRYVLLDSQCQIAVVENLNQLKKILAIRDQVPSLKHIIMWNNKETTPADSNVLSWEELVSIGQKEDDDALIDRLKRQVPNQCCSLIYTSGTTGNPKGVMISQDNFTWTARWLQRHFQFPENGKLITVSYLPLSHVAGQIADLYLTICVAGCVVFAQPDALRGSLKDTLCEVRPTIFLGVPRVFEKFQEKMKETSQSMGWLKQYIARWAKYVGYKGSVSAINGDAKPWGWWLADKVVLSKVKYALGLDRCTTIVTSAAPITKDTLEFFLALDLRVLEMYGASETTGPLTFNTEGQHRVTSVGPCPDGSLIKFDTEGRGDGNEGEVCVFGRNVFMGYLNSKDKTAETIDQEGWLRSGDVGRLDEEDFLYITGRIKEIIVTAGGENIAPIPIEDRLREELPCISNAMVVGDKRKFLTVLLTFKTLVNDVTNEPLDELTSTAKSWCKTVTGEEINTVSDVRSGRYEQIPAAFEAALKKVNAQAVSRASHVQKFTILPRDFSLFHGEYGPTMKVRRPIVQEMYGAEIDSLYSD